MEVLDRSIEAPAPTAVTAYEPPVLLDLEDVDTTPNGCFTGGSGSC